MSQLALVPFTLCAEYQQASAPCFRLCSYAMSQKIQKWHCPPNHSFLYSECDGVMGTPISTVERHFCRSNLWVWKVSMNPLSCVQPGLLKTDTRLWWDMIVNGRGRGPYESWLVEDRFLMLVIYDYLCLSDMLLIVMTCSKLINKPW